MPSVTYLSSAVLDGRPALHPPRFFFRLAYLQFAVGALRLRRGLACTALCFQFSQARGGEGSSRSARQRS